MKRLAIKVGRDIYYAESVPEVVRGRGGAADATDTLQTHEPDAI